MGLFLASIGVALVLRQAILLVWGPQPRAYDVDPFKVYVIGDVRLSLAQVATIVAAAAAILVIGLFLARTTTGRVMRAMSDDRALAQVSGIDVDRVVVVTWIISGFAAGLAGVLAALVQSSFDPNFGFQLLLPVFAAVVLGGIGSAYGALAGGLVLGRRDRALDLGGVRRRRRSGLQAGRRVRRPDRGAAAPTAGPLRPREDRMSVLTSAEFWAFVGVVAGIYTLFTLGLQVQFGLAGLLNFGQVGFMAIGAYTMAILVAKEGWSMWVATPVAIAAAALAGVLVGLPTLRLRGDYFAIVTIAFSEIVRWVATNEDGLTGGAQGTINLAGQGTAAQYNGQWERFQRWVGAQLHVGDKDVVMLLLVWAAALLLVWLTARLARTPWGRVLRAIREDEDATASLGKHVFSYRLQALALGAALAGLAGCVYAWQFSFFSPDDYQPLITFFGWMILILGGVGRVWAVPVGALVFGFLFAATRFFDFAPFSYLDSADRAYVRLMLIGLVIILLVVFRPQGLLGRRDEMVLE